MKIATWNVNSINVRMPQLLGWLAETADGRPLPSGNKDVDENFPIASCSKMPVMTPRSWGRNRTTALRSFRSIQIKDVQKNFLDDDDESPKRLIAATVNGVRIVNTYIPNGTELWTDKFTFQARLASAAAEVFRRDSAI